MFIPQVQSVRRSGCHRLECTRDLGEVGQVPFPGRTGASWTQCRVGGYCRECSESEVVLLFEINVITIEPKLKTTETKQIKIKTT